MPAGELVTVPEPVPSLVTVSRCCSSVKVAVTSLAADIVTRHLFSPLTESQPLQETGLVPALELPVRVTRVPSSYSAEHSEPQLMPAGELVTVPEPDPCFLTFSRYLGISMKVALTVFASDIVTLHSPVPEQAPDQPENL